MRETHTHNHIYIYIYIYIKWTVFVNVNTKSAQHAHARMIAIIVGFGLFFNNYIYMYVYIYQNDTRNVLMMEKRRIKRYVPFNDQHMGLSDLGIKIVTSNFHKHTNRTNDITTHKSSKIIIIDHPYLPILPNSVIAP